MKKQVTLLAFWVLLLGTMTTLTSGAEINILSSIDDSRTNIVPFVNALGYGAFGNSTSVLLDPNKLYNFTDEQGNITEGTLFDMDVVFITQFSNAAALRTGVAPGGTLDEYVSQGGVLVIVAAGSSSQNAIAPGGVDYVRSVHLSDEISSPSHPYLTGEGFSGHPLDANDFDGWLPTDLGTLENLVENSEIILSNTDGPSWVEYPWGNGIVIVTSLTYGFNCGVQCSNPLRDNPLENLIDYAVFSTLQGSIDSDNDGLTDTEESILGTDPTDPDTDDDGLLDGTEVDMAEDSGCPDPLNADSDGDGLLDGVEVVTETNPCNPDSDGDGLDDASDPLPNEPGATTGYLEDQSRTTAQDIGVLGLELFSGSNNNANKGRRNSLANRTTEAANLIATDDIAGAIDSLNSLLSKIDGQPVPKDWMDDSEEKALLAEDISLLIELLAYEL